MRGKYILTDTELAMCRLLGANYVSRNHDSTLLSHTVEFWDAQPWAYGELWYGDYGWDEGGLIATLNVEYFPTKLEPGMCVQVMYDGSCKEVETFMRVMDDGSVMEANWKRRRSDGIGLE